MLIRGRESGTIRVTGRGGGIRAGPYTPVSAGSQARDRVVIGDTAAVRDGRTYTVVLKPGGGEAVRSGPGGVPHAWAPLGGAPLLASVVVAGGLGRVRAARLMAGSGVAPISAAFFAVQDARPAGGAPPGRSALGGTAVPPCSA
ncbi:hypothetical protein GCM10020295_49460 [Streptomyces cinereospinus]